MRGKEKSAILSLLENRITPAYAGKSTSDTVKGFIQWDHPRLCGEKRNSQKLRGSASGSPPPMRGKVILHYQIRSAFGITPAYAGKRTDAEIAETVK